MATKKTEATEAPTEVLEPVDAVSVDDVPVTEVPIDSQPETVVLAETTPPPPPPVQEIIVVDAPVAPRKKGNRGLGVALALVATLVFLVLLAVAVFIVTFFVSGTTSPAFLLEPGFYFPAVFFFIGLALVSIVINRAGWAAHIIGSVAVAVIVLFGSAGLQLVAAGVLSMTQGEANDVYFAALLSPHVITATILAREVAIWTGAILARRGRRLKTVNAEAYAAFEREQAELTPTA